MPITNDQKADIGRRYVAEIKRRTEVREKAKLRASFTVEDEDGEEIEVKESPVVAVAKQIAKKHGVPFETSGLGTCYRRNEQTRTLIIKGGGFSLEVPVDAFPALVKAVKAKDDAEKLRKDLCSELSFLHGARDAAHISDFQTYVGRLWSPAKNERLPEGQFAEFVNDYLLSKHSFTCKL